MQGIEQVRAEADAVQDSADRLQVDLEDFEAWLADPSARVDELRTDVDMLADSFSEREAALDDFPARTAGVADGTSGDEAGGDAWAEAAVSHRVTSLLLEDVRAELAGLERIAERQDTATDDLATIDARLADLEDRWRAIDERIEDLARPAWRDRFDDRLAAVEAVLEDFEPPVDLGELQTAIEETRP